MAVDAVRQAERKAPGTASITTSASRPFRKTRRSAYSPFAAVLEDSPEDLSRYAGSARSKRRKFFRTCYIRCNTPCDILAPMRCRNAPTFHYVRRRPARGREACVPPPVQLEIPAAAGWPEFWGRIARALRRRGYRHESLKCYRQVLRSFARCCPRPADADQIGRAHV